MHQFDRQQRQHELNKSIIKYDGDDKKVLIVAIWLMKDFDAHIDGIEDNTIESTSNTCTDILHWLYLASKGKIDSIPTIAYSVRQVRKYFNLLQQPIGFNGNKNLQTNPSNNNISVNLQKPLEIIAASSSSTQDFLSKLTQI